MMKMGRPDQVHVCIFTLEKSKSVRYSRFEQFVLKALVQLHFCLTARLYYTAVRYRGDAIT